MTQVESAALAREPQDSRAATRLLTVMNCPSTVRGGMPTANRNLSAALEREGWQVTNLYLDHLPSWVARRPLNYPGFAPAARAAIRRLERQTGPFDILQFSGGDGWLAPLMRWGPSGRRLLVAKCHGLEHRFWAAYVREVAAGRERLTLRHRAYFGALRLVQVRRSISAADLLVCHTEADAGYAVERGWITEARVAVIGEGVNDHWLTLPIDRRPRGGRFIWSGSWNWMKGHRTLVAAFERIAAADPSLQLTLIGTGTAEPVVLEAFPEPLRHRISVFPALPHEEVRELFQTHDALLATSNFEGHGTVVIEAMAAGLPVIATGAGAWPDRIRESETGFTAKAGDPDSFVSAWRRLVSLSDEQVLDLRRRARRAVSDLTWDAVGRRTAAVYLDALERVRGGRRPLSG